MAKEKRNLPEIRDLYADSQMAILSKYNNRGAK